MEFNIMGLNFEPGVDVCMIGGSYLPFSDKSDKFAGPLYTVRT